LNLKIVKSLKTNKKVLCVLTALIALIEQTTQ